MYKRLYLNKQVPADRRSYNLVTHDIDGAQPRAWTHPERPFFRHNDPETHLATQNDQYNVALHEQLLYREKEREPHWKTSKKCDFPDIQAKVSQIGREKMINGREDLSDVRKAKQVFYPRNLNTDDIEGTDVGSLNTKFMKNWQLAQDIKSHPSLRQHRVDVDIHVPYGDGLNKEQYLPEHLRRAREMAGKNRNRLRLMNNVEKGPLPAVEGVRPPDYNLDYKPDQRQFSQAETRPLRPEYVQQVPADAGPPVEGYVGLNNQYEDSRNLYEQNRMKSIESDINGNQQETNDARATNTDVTNGIRETKQDPIEDETWRQAMNQMHRDRERLEGLRQARDMRQWSKAAYDEQVEQTGRARSQEESLRTHQHDSDSIRGRHNDAYGPMTTSQKYDRPPELHSNEQQDYSYPNEFIPRDAYEPYGQYRLQDSGAQDNQRRPVDRAEATLPPIGYRGQASESKLATQNAPREIFRNSNEFQTFQKLSEDDKKIYMGTFLRGLKGREFNLEPNKSDKLKHLNDFYADFLSEQYKRRSPLTKDDYTYQSTVKHLKRNGIL